MPNMRNGDYVGPTGWFELWGSPGPAQSTRASQDLANAQALWRFSEQATNITADFRQNPANSADPSIYALKGEGAEA
jgi:hypothetical protein